MQQHQPQEGASAAAKEETKEDTTAATTTSATAPATTPVSATAVGIITSEQRRRMEQNRKRAFELRQLREQKKLKGASVVASANLITPAATTASVKNPYAKASSSRSTLVIATPVVQQQSTTQNAAASGIKKSTLFPTPPPPAVTSAWGDCRLDLWETLCRCGGAAEHSPDIRMCQCGAAYDAGLQCDGCGCGVLLMKSGPRGNNFWGCSQYKKRGV